uniref:Uncharacterized protein n=1 Tax=viral metagenome TaxID=1070528 RepID=A0A6C0DN23_9ZZZZ
MAYCMIDISNSFSIKNWGVLTMMEKQAPPPICSCLKILKSKRALPKPCAKPAKYEKNGGYYCENHAQEKSATKECSGTQENSATQEKSATKECSGTQENSATQHCSGFILPTKERTHAYLQKQPLESLVAIGKSHHLFLEDAPKTKKMAVETLNNFYKERCFNVLVLKKAKHADEIDLICIGKTMKTLLNDVSGIDQTTHVVIENQISPIANRMKTIQGMLAQYFIMKNSDTHIEFVSSIHKLNQFKDISGVVLSTKGDNGDKSNYRDHKRDGVDYTQQLLNANPEFQEQKPLFLESKKKDDLADSFLQGLWYAKHHKKIRYSNELRIITQ